MIEKPLVVVTSLGRTGTLFFASLFEDVIPNGTCLHEPDILTTTELRKGGKGITHIVQQICKSGPYNMLVKKPLGKWNLAKVSDDRFRRQIGYEEAVQRTMSQRIGFIHSCGGAIYVESSTAYYGLIDVLKDVFLHHRIVYLIRDGRDWVRSWMNSGQRGGMYTKGKFRSIFARNWPTARDVDDEYCAKWELMTWFEKLCWAWARLNEYALRTVERNPSARVFRFEDIFTSENRYQHLAALVDFATDLPGVQPVPSEALEGWLERKIHTSSGDFPAWPGWPVQHREQFIEICGPLMESLEYDID
jgi:hypothetical protein